MSKTRLGSMIPAGLILAMVFPLPAYADKQIVTPLVDTGTAALLLSDGKKEAVTIPMMVENNPTRGIVSRHDLANDTIPS